jgi:hypothetical protein
MSSIHIRALINGLIDNDNKCTSIIMCTFTTTFITTATCFDLPQIILILLNLFGYPDWGFFVLFPHLQGKCQGIIRKDWARPALFQICYLCCFICYSCCFVVNCEVLCNMCKCVLPPGVNPIAVDKYININIIRWSVQRKRNLVIV